MDATNNVLLALAIIMPVALYALVFLVMMPKKTVEFLHAPLYFCGGIFSVILIRLLFFMFPTMDIPLSETAMGMLFMMMVQVGLVEEGVKMFMFRLARRYHRSDSVHSTVFMYLSVGSGFAVIENFLYVSMLGPEVLFARLLTATLMHMSVGIVAGRMWADKKPWLGFLLAVFIHGSYNFILTAMDSSLSLVIGTGFAVMSAVICCHDLIDVKFFRED